MSSMSCCTTACLMSPGDSALALARSTGWPMRATLRIDMIKNYTMHDDTHAFRFCPRCGGTLERKLLKSAEPERLVCSACGFVFYLDPKIAVGTMITSWSERLGA